jgi:hypothetical protein
MTVGGTEPPRLRRIPSGGIDEATVADAIAMHIGARPIRLTPRATHPPRFVYEAEFDGAPSVFFKGERDAAGDDAIVLECWAMDAARKSGAPAPEVIVLDTSEAIFPGRFAIFERAPGIALCDAPTTDPARARQEAGAAMRAVHEVRVPGFGFLDDERYLDTGDVRADPRTWREHALHTAARAIRLLVGASALEFAVAAAFERVLADADALFDYTDGRLIHGDLDETHIFVDPATGTLTSIIDWGDRGAADPLWDLGVLFQWDGPVALQHVLDGYAPDPVEQESLRARIDVYALCYALRLAGARCKQGRNDDARHGVADVRTLLRL